MADGHEGLINCPCNLYELAKEICLHIDRPKRHCSVILHKGRVVAVGTNQMKTHPLARKYKYLFDEMHSELDAFRKCKNKQGLELWNFRFNRFGQERISRPCLKCLPWCVEVFDSIYFTTGHGLERLRPLPSSQGGGCFFGGNRQSGLTGR